MVSECTFNWYWLADACFEAKIPFVLAHALYLKHIHGGKNKNDRLDSEKLAHLLRGNLIPPAYIYPSERRPIRALLRQRMSYVWQRARLMAHLSMNQTAVGLVPALKGGHKRRDGRRNGRNGPAVESAAHCGVWLHRQHSAKSHAAGVGDQRPAERANGKISNALICCMLHIAPWFMTRCF